MAKGLGKVINTGKGNQKRVKRVVKDNKVGLSVIGGAFTVLTVGAGLVSSLLVNNKKGKKAKKKIEELETENQRLEALLINMNKVYAKSVINSDGNDSFEDYVHYEEEDYEEDYDYEGFEEDYDAYLYPEYEPDESEYEYFKALQDAEYEAYKNMADLGDIHEELRESDDDDYSFSLLSNIQEDDEELAFEYPTYPEDVNQDDIESFNQFQKERADSLEKDGDDFVPEYVEDADDAGDILESAEKETIEEALNELDSK